MTALCVLPTNKNTTNNNTNNNNNIVHAHPLQHSEQQWPEMEQRRRREIHRRVFGLHAPLRERLDEQRLRLVSGLSLMPSSSNGLSSSLAMDILEGRDDCVAFGEALGGDAPGAMWNVHAYAEVHRLGFSAPL